MLHCKRDSSIARRVQQLLSAEELEKELCKRLGKDFHLKAYV